MADREEYIKWFSEISNKDVSTAGGKGASLGEMYNAGFPVPPGFVITAQGFDYFLKSTGVKDKIKALVDSIEMENTQELTKRSNEIRALIESQELPSDLKQEILEAYRILSSEKIETRGISINALNILKNSQEPIFVAIRSSATTEDLAEASFAGQQESFLNIKGEARLIEYVKKCFSSLFTARAIYYRTKQGFGAADALLSAVIMKMIDSEKSGVMFSRSPMGDKDEITIEAVYGLGEGIVSGQINPDHYIVTRDLKIKSIKLSEKKIAIVRTGSGNNETIKLTSQRSKMQVMTNGQIIEAANYAIRLEEHYKKPQDIEFAIEANKLYIVQSRPITTLNKEVKQVGTISGKILLEGQGSSPGIGVGIVKIIRTMADLPKIKKGDVLVTEMTNPDMVVAMEKSVAIITDEGGMTSHAAIVSREMGIPCVVGTDKATKLLKEGMKVTVDGTNGKIYEGAVAETHFTEIKKALPTNKVKLKVIVDLPESAERAALTGIDSVGLTRVEGIIAHSEKHPLQFEKEKDYDGYSELIRKGIDEIAKHFEQQWIRTSDIRTDEYNSLKGAPEREINPMLGLHGIRFSLKYPKLFEAELLAIKKVAEKYPKKRFGVMFPQVILIEEVRKAREYFEKYKIANMEFGVMIETPAAVQIIESICKEGIDFISFGTNDLTQFTLAIDRGEESVQYLYNELNPAIYSQIKRVINVCRQYKVYTSICGQAGSKREMAEFLFNQGINSISVNSDAAYDISKLIVELEETRSKEIEERKKNKNINKFYQTSRFNNNEPEKIIEKETEDKSPIKVKEYNEFFENNYVDENEGNSGLLSKENIKIPAELEEEIEVNYVENQDLNNLQEKKVKEIGDLEIQEKDYTQESNEGGGNYEKVGEYPEDNGELAKRQYNMFDEEYSSS